MKGADQIRRFATLGITCRVIAGSRSRRGVHKRTDSHLAACQDGYAPTRRESYAVIVITCRP